MLATANNYFKVLQLRHVIDERTSEVLWILRLIELVAGHGAAAGKQIQACGSSKQFHTYKDHIKEHECYIDSVGDCAALHPLIVPANVAGITSSSFYHKLSMHA